MLRFAHILLLILIMALGVACDEGSFLPISGNDADKATELAEICIIERQCFADPFVPSDPEATREQRIAAMKDYLQSLGLDFGQVTLEEDYFEAVCEACVVCPSGDRFVIEAEPDARGKLQARDVWLMDCDET